MASTRTRPAFRALTGRLALVVSLVAGLVAVATFRGAGSAGASQTDCLSYAYACTPGYTGANAAGTWAWSHYGGSYAVTPNGYHNCTLYAAWRLQQNGMGDPGNWGNAADWASHNGGGNNTPSIGAIAWWGTEVGGGYGHVAYVDQVNGTQVHVVADNYSTTKGYTDSGWIAVNSVDKFLHPHDVSGTTRASFNGDGKTDLVYQDPKSTSIRVITSGGTTASGNSVWAGGMGMSAWRVAGDFNGDGKTDLLYQDSNSANFYLLTSTGSGFSNQVWAGGMGQPAWEADG
jgi:surface antigen